MSDRTLDVPIAGPPVPRVPALAHECTVAGIRMMALPPGPAEVMMTPDWHILNFVPRAQTNDVIRVGGQDYAALRARFITRVPAV